MQRNKTSMLSSVSERREQGTSNKERQHVIVCISASSGIEQVTVVATEEDNWEFEEQGEREIFFLFSPLCT